MSDGPVDYQKVAFYNEYIRWRRLVRYHKAEKKFYLANIAEASVRHLHKKYPDFPRIYREHFPEYAHEEFA